MSGPQIQTVGSDEGGVRLDRWLRRRMPGLTQGRIEKMLRTGQIRVDGAKAKSNTRLEAGQEIRIPPLDDTDARPDRRADARREVRPADIDFIKSLILYQDDELIALNKPAGLAVQGGSGQSRHIDGLLPALARKDEVPRLVHRLDRDTSGVLVVARTAPAAAKLADQFRSRKAEKTYWAIVLGAIRPPFGEVSGWMKKGPAGAVGREQMTMVGHGETDARHARTLYATIAEAGRAASWVALRPVTGRTHQLRVHMAELGHAIGGDRKYRCDRPTPDALEGKLQLHARQLVLPRKGGPLILTAPPPPHMKMALDALGLSETKPPADPFEELER